MKSEMECSACPAGYLAGIQNSPDCKQCPAARFASEEEASNCDPCNIRSWTQNLLGKSVCVPCFRGETFAGDRCEVCGEGKYSLLAGENFFGCHQCPDGAECPGAENATGNMTRDQTYNELLMIEPSFWKSPGSIKSQERANNFTCGSAVRDQRPWQCDVDGKLCDTRNGQYYDECGVLRTIMPCLNPKACIGTKAANFSNNTCDVVNGYIGPLCQTCDTKGGFFMTSNGCDTCKNRLPAEIRLVILVGSVVIGGLLVRMIMKKLNKHRKYDEVVRHITELVVVMFDFMQIAGSVSSLYSVRMPPYLKKFLSDANVVNFDIVDMLSLNCFGEDVTFYAAFTMTMLIPIAVLLLCYIAYFFTTKHAELKLKKLKAQKMGWGRLIRMLSLQTQKQSDRRSRFMVLGLSTLSLLYMPLTVRCFRFFQCIMIDDKSYLMADFREECYTTKWFGFIFVAIIVIIFYCILFPIYIFKTLFHIRDKLDTMAIKHKVS